jgi:hypothetical protein
MGGGVLEVAPWNPYNRGRHPPPGKRKGPTPPPPMTPTKSREEEIAKREKNKENLYKKTSN